MLLAGVEVGAKVIDTYDCGIIEVYLGGSGQDQILGCFNTETTHAND
jgi:hypothetical protein